ncbi:hypothetical protein K492DRAFT_185103 [Lichtheimia hyalospora FSU 10163]|nr:hypothetical protein K492DRAFT_185103 [Lichtheimia hyalospora FSU 10163]
MAGSSSSTLARYLCILAIGISLPLGVLATPAWNTVNGVYPNGTTCPLPTYHAYTCAPLCVRDIASCPESIRPTCPEGQTYCVDGTCRSSCPSDLKSQCSCPGAPEITVPIYACKEGSRADIHNFVATNKSAQRAEACAIEIGVPTSISAWDGANPPDMMWGECPTPDYGELNFHEPAFIALYVFYGSCVAMFILWTLYKRLREKVNMVALSKKARRHDGLNEKIDDKDSDTSVVANKKSDGVKNKDTASDTTGDHDAGMVIKAYKVDYIGFFCFILYILQTLGMVAYMIMIVNDYYDDYILFRGFQIVQSSTFIGMWYIFFIWFACLAIFKNRLMNFFRIRCSYTEADYVQIENHQAPIIFSQDQSDRLMDTVRWAENLVSHAIGLDVVVTTSKMRATNTGVKYFVYQCTRYVYDPHSETFNPHDFDLGDTNASLAALKDGLSSEEASRREELIGLNFINVYVPNIPMAVLREFSAFFYIYQFSVLWIFYYFAFWTVGVSDTAVILLSAVINVFVKLRSERRIKKMAEFTDNSGDTRTIMITGDTALTGVFIARQCGMALPNSRILLGDLDKKTNRVVWADVDEPDTFPDVNPDEYLHNKDHTPVELAVTGKAFQWLVDNDLIRKYLLDIRVFARMTPTGKVLCVQLHMERGITAMTGDGGNDCGALRTAHVGIAMSDAEASIVSPFSTSIRSVKSCVELIRQGRAALTTSLTGYKYLILYGQVMVMMKIITFYFSITMSQYVWIAIDVFITVFLSWAVSQSKAADRLEPCRPTARLLGPQTLASCLGLVSINWIYMCCAFYMLYQQEWFRCNEFDSNAVDISKWWLLADNYEAEVLTVVGMFMFINNAAVFSFGYKFRRPIYRNYPLIFLWALYIAIVSYWTLADPNRFGCLFRLNCGTPQVLQELGYPVPPTYIEDYNLPLGHNIMPWDFRWRLWGLCLGNMATALLYERIIVLGPVHTYLAKRFPLARLRITR